MINRQKIKTGEVYVLFEIVKIHNPTYLQNRVVCFALGDMKIRQTFD